MNGPPVLPFLTGRTFVRLILLILRLVFVTTTSKNVISLIMASVLSVTANMLHVKKIRRGLVKKTATDKAALALICRRPIRNVLMTALIMTNASAVPTL